MDPGFVGSNPTGLPSSFERNAGVELDWMNCFDIELPGGWLFSFDCGICRTHICSDLCVGMRRRLSVLKTTISYLNWHVSLRWLWFEFGFVKDVRPGREALLATRKGDSHGAGC